MAKLTAWLVTLIGVILLLNVAGIDIGTDVSAWLIALSVLVIGVAKLTRNYSSRKMR
mgnify:FL=1